MTTTKTHAEFLEELKEHIKQRTNIRTEIMGDDYIDKTMQELMVILNKIEQFQAEQNKSSEEVMCWNCDGAGRVSWYYDGELTEAECILCDGTRHIKMIEQKKE
jgi:hypothetical protein